MKRKFLIILLSVVSALCLCFGITACSNDGETSDWENGIFSIETAYAEAQDLGYSGTLQEFIASISGSDGTNGTDGIGITDVSFNSDGELVVTLSSGKTINLGDISGQDGVGISTVVIENGKLIVTLTDGTEIDCGTVVGSNGEDGNNGVGISSVAFNESGELVVTYTDGTYTNLGDISGTDGVGVSSISIDEDGVATVYYTDNTYKELGNIVGKDGESAYEIYLKYHPEYEGDEEQWIADLISGAISQNNEIDYVPTVSIRAAVGEEVVLPETMTVYFADGGYAQCSVTWSKTTVSSDYLGYKEITGYLDDYGVAVTCYVRIVSYETTEKYVDGYVNGLLEGDTALVTIFSDEYLQTVEVSGDGYYCFSDLDSGSYYLKIDATGYYAADIAETSVSSVTTDEDSLYDNIKHVNFNLVCVRESGYYYVWTSTETGTSTESSAYVNTVITVEFLDEPITVSDIGYATELRERYNLVLVDSEEIWSSEVITRFYELYTSLPDDVISDINSVWTLTSSNINNDITYEETDGVYYVTVAKAAIENVTLRVAVADGETGTYFSNRLYNAIVRFVTNGGNDADKCESILNTNFACSFNVPDYSKLTASTTVEDESSFQEFLPEEKLLILTMFEEMPEGMHKLTELKYLVRRKTGQSNPIYPESAAVTWVYADTPYIEFMDVTFDGSDGYYETKRLIIHEKMHIFYSYYFSDALKEAWYEVGGWYVNAEDEDGWSTTKETEFVSAYAHAHNPDEDLAESVATYIINPDLLRSRSQAKYEFIKNYIMNGSFYLLQIREDLTFEVYNLNPDYMYPGKISQISVSVQGGAYEDKTVTFEITLQDGGVFTGASGCMFRLVPYNPYVDQYYDVRCNSVDDSGLVLRGTVVISKYSYQGYWYTDQIIIYDDVGNERYESNSDYSMKVYIDNPLMDLEPAALVSGSLELSLENANNEEHPDAQYLVVQFEYTENIDIRSVLVRLYCQDANKYSIDTYADELEIDRENGIVTMRVYIPEHYSTGTYEISEIYFVDVAGNMSFYHVSYGTLVGENNTIYIQTTNPDDTGAVLDVNNIEISAVPSNPDAPNGETYVTITISVSDDISGVYIGYINLLDPQGILHGYYIYFPYTLIGDTYYYDGDPTQPMEFTFTITLPEGSAPGTWGIYEISLTDYALNIAVYDFTEIVHFEVTDS